MRFASVPQRFSRSVPVSSCSTPVINASKNYYPTCWNSPPVEGANHTEDCLVLSVYRPDAPLPAGQLRPVVFWIYGGSNVQGSITSSFYKGLPSMPYLEDVVVVAANYRLGLFGRLATSGLSAESKDGASGNQAITDLVAALQWTQKNIESFGGNSSQVSLLGQSSGGSNILQLLRAPSAAGLFHSAISLSGSANMTQQLPQAEALYAASLRRLPATAPCHNATATATHGGGGNYALQQQSEQMLRCLRSLSAHDLAVAGAQMLAQPFAWPTTPAAGLPSGPGLCIVDGVIVTRASTEPTLFPHVPVVLSSVEYGMILGLISPYSGPFPRPATLPAFAAQLRHSMAAAWPAENGSAVADMYVAASRNVMGAQSLLFSDWQMTGGQLMMGRVAPSYVLVLNLQPGNPQGVPNPPNPPMHYGFHGMDTMLLWHDWDMLGPPAYQPTASDFAASQALRDILRPFLRSQPLPPTGSGGSGSGSTLCRSDSGCMNTFAPNGTLLHFSLNAEPATTAAAAGELKPGPAVLRDATLRSADLTGLQWYSVN